MTKLKKVSQAYRAGATVVGATLATSMAFSTAYANEHQIYDYIFGAYGYVGHSNYTGKGNFEGDATRWNYGGKADLALTGNWRMAFIAEGTRDQVDIDGRKSDLGDNTFWASSYTYTRLGEGSFAGIESGYRSHSEAVNSQDFFKIGVFGRHRFNDQWALNGWAGALVPFPNDDDQVLDTSYYASGTITYYVSDTWSVNAYADWSVANFENTDQEFHSLRAGLRATVLTPIEGVTVWGSGGYSEAWFEGNNSKGFEFDGPEFMIGLSIALFSGGMMPTSLVTFDDHTFNTPVYAVSSKF